MLTILQYIHVDIRCSYYDTNVHLHWTLTKTLAVVFPASFDALHMYIPESSLSTPSMTKDSFSLYFFLLPTLVQVMFGAGIPVALQKRFTVPVSLTVVFTGWTSSLGGTGLDHKTRRNKELYHSSSRKLFYR